jgi:hypothetical protein
MNFELRLKVKKSRGSKSQRRYPIPCASYAPDHTMIGYQAGTSVQVGGGNSRRVTPPQRVIGDPPKPEVAAGEERRLERLPHRSPGKKIQLFITK